MNRSESYLLYFLQTFFIVASRSERDLCDFFKMCVLMSCHENRKSFQTLFSSLYQPLVRLECEWLSVLLTQGPLLHAAAVLTSDPMQLCSYCDHITRTVSNGFHGKKKKTTLLHLTQFMVLFLHLTWEKVLAFKIKATPTFSWFCWYL